MATTANAFEQARHRLWLGRLTTIAILLVAAALFWLAANYHTTAIKKEAPISMLLPVQAPPPPPPPPKPQEVVKETTLAPQQTLTPKSAVKDNALTENAEAQDGTDAFGIGSGTGEGMRGSGIAGTFERGAYASYLAGIIREAVRHSDLHNKAFRVAISLWLSPAGKISRAELRSTTGSSGDDQALQALLIALPQLGQLPPQSVLDTQPVNMTIDLRQSL